MNGSRLAAAVEVPPGEADAEAVVVLLRITNTGDEPATVLNPDIGVPPPDLGWDQSDDAYRASLLMSYHYLAVSLAGDDDAEPPRRNLQTWATPVLQPRVELAAGESLAVRVPLGELFELASGAEYRLELAYGDDDARVEADARVTVP